MTSISQAWKNLERAEYNRNSAALFIASSVANGEKVDDLRVEMFKDAEKAVATADHIVRKLLEAKVESSD